MKEITIFPIGISKSCQRASLFLKEAGFVLTDHPTPEITHLLLDVPSFDENGNLRDGANLQEHLVRLPESVTVIGGNLRHPSLSHYQKIDLLDNAYFLAKNASITAQCAIQIGSSYLSTVLSDSSALVLGWGRIGKCLCALLKSAGCHVTVATRKDIDRAMLEALGYETVDFSDVPNVLFRHQILFNTVPQQTVNTDVLNRWKNGIKLDLASAPGMTCDGVIVARGLPGKYAPETTGKLIAEFIRQALKETKP